MPKRFLTDQDPHRETTVHFKGSIDKNEQYPLVSLVLPIKNEGPYIKEALEAIDRQKYPKDKIEIIIADGGSSDNTLDIVREKMAKDSRIKVTGGPGVNCPLGMNMGIEMALGTIVAKVDGHVLLPGFQRFLCTRRYPFQLRRQRQLLER